MSGSLSAEQRAALIRAASLLSQWGGVLAPFEADLVAAAVDRFRRTGDRTALTANEWRVIEESVAGMDAALDDARRGEDARRLCLNASWSGSPAVEAR